MLCAAWFLSLSCHDARRSSVCIGILHKVLSHYKRHCVPGVGFHAKEGIQDLTAKAEMGLIDYMLTSLV